jgi:5-methylcytosine-specific restriction endonuclease McrA
LDSSLVEEVWERAKGVCEYCHLPHEFDVLTFQIDHVIALKHHGTDDLENLALACFACNNHKGANIAGIDPTTGELTRLFHPRRDRWEDHFDWDAGVLVGRTAIGRTTVDVLAVNIRHRVQLREALRDEGVFPTSE